MNVQQRFSGLWPLTQIMLIGGGFVLIIAGLRASASIINIFLLAYIITLLAAPLYRRLIKLRIPSFIAVVLVLFVFFLIIFGLGLFLASSVASIQARLFDYETGITDKVLEMSDTLSESGLFNADQVSDTGVIDFGQIIGTVFGFVSQLVSGFASMLTNMSLVLLIVFFALFEVSAAPDRLVQGLGLEHSIHQRFYRLSENIRTYFWIKTLTGFLNAIINTILLLVLGVEFAFLWGVVSFLLNFIPNVGFVIALIPPTLVALLQFGLGKALLVVVGYFAINFIFDNLISPRLMGKGVNLSPVMVFVALIFWGWVLGILGAILAVPFMLILKMMLESDENARWLSLLMSESSESAENT